MAGVHRVATSILKWFSALYVVAIIIQVFLAGEGIFRLSNIKNDCSHSSDRCVANTTTLDPHRALGFFLTMPGALLFLIVALLAWHPNTRIRIVSILVPILTFTQMIWAGIGGWVGGIHPVNAILVLGMYGWLSYKLFTAQPEEAIATAPATASVT